MSPPFKELDSSRLVSSKHAQNAAMRRMPCVYTHVKNTTILGVYNKICMQV